MRLGGGRKRRDANESEIILKLRQVGARVIQLNGAAVPDLLVGYRGRWVPMEVKTATGGFTKLQAEAMVNGEMPFPVVRSFEDAFALIGLGR